jgi:aspartate kinase
MFAGSPFNARPSTLAERVLSLKHKSVYVPSATNYNQRMGTTLVVKFGGAAVATPEAFGEIAAIIERRLERHSSIVAVVSAMGDMTNQLVRLATQVHPQPPKREMDMLVSVGERISTSLLAMALANRGVEAVSFTGSQSGILTSSAHTEARILGVRPHRLLPHIKEGRVAIVAGFQGVSEACEITTLGRGGSDTTAVALAVALDAERVEFYKEVDGVYEMDPNQFPRARRIAQLTYAEATAICEQASHPVLHPRAVALAQANGLPLLVRSFHTDEGGTWIRGEIAGIGVPTYESIS